MIDKKEIAIEVVLYNPQKEDIIRLNRYLNDFDLVIFFDNTEDNRSYLHLIEKHEKLVYIHLKENMGLSYAYNYAINYCNRNKIDYLCTMDQDSIFESKDIQEIKKVIFSNDNDDKVAIYSPIIIFEGKKKSSVIKNKSSYTDVEWVISSGTFINLNIIIKENILFDENYFIDRVDVDFCKQIKLKGYKIIRCNKSELKQSLGELTNKGVIQHSALRYYYISRNRLYYNRKYFNFFKFISLSLIQLFKNIIRVLLFEDDKFEKIKNIFIGIDDFKKNKYGRYKIIKRKN